MVTTVDELFGRCRLADKGGLCSKITILSSSSQASPKSVCGTSSSSSRRSACAALLNLPWPDIADDVHLGSILPIYLQLLNPVNRPHRQMLSILKKASKQPGAAAVLLYFLEYPSLVLTARQTNCPEALAKGDNTTTMGQTDKYIISKKKRYLGYIEHRLNRVMERIACNRKLGKWCRQAIANSVHHPLVLSSALGILKSSLELELPLLNQNKKQRDNDYYCHQNNSKHQLLYISLLNLSEPFDVGFHKLYRDLSRLVFAVEDDNRVTARNHQCSVLLPNETILVIFQLLMEVALLGKGKGTLLMTMRPFVGTPANRRFQLALQRLRKENEESQTQHYHHQQPNVPNHGENAGDDWENLMNLFSAMFDESYDFDRDDLFEPCSPLPSPCFSTSTSSTSSSYSSSTIPGMAITLASSSDEQSLIRSPARNCFVSEELPKLGTKSRGGEDREEGGKEGYSTSLPTFDEAFGPSTTMDTMHKSYFHSLPGSPPEESSMTNITLGIIDEPKTSCADSSWAVRQSSSFSSSTGTRSRAFVRQTETIESGWVDAEESIDYFIFDTHEDGHYKVITFENVHTKSLIQELRFHAIHDPSIVFHLYCHFLASLGSQGRKRMFQKKLRHQLKDEYGIDPLQVLHHVKIHKRKLHDRSNTFAGTSVSSYNNKIMHDHMGNHYAILLDSVHHATRDKRTLVQSLVQDLCSWQSVFVVICVGTLSWLFKTAFLVAATTNPKTNCWGMTTMSPFVSLAGMRE